MLLEMPRYIGQPALPLFSPGSFMTKTHAFDEVVVVYASPNNPGSAELAQEMSDSFNVAQGLHGEALLANARALAKPEATFTGADASTPRRCSRSNITLPSQLKFRVTSVRPNVIVRALEETKITCKSLLCCS